MFEEFVRKLSIEISSGLPGFSVQKIMAPIGRRKPEEYLQKGIVPRDSAVLILLYPFRIENFDTVKTVLIIRVDQGRGVHSGQIAFPGGCMEKADADLAQTALREAEEEIGVEPGMISIIGALTPLYIPVSNFMVHPFVGVSRTQPAFNIHSGEVQSVMEVLLDDLLSDQRKGWARRYVKLRGEEIDVPCYTIHGEVIWGATAMMIAELVEIVKRVK